MIQVVTGKLGAGKTLYSVMLMFEKLCKGATVVTNIAVNWPEMVSLARRRHRVVLQDSQLIKIDPGADPNWHRSIPFGTSVMFVECFFDEIHLFFNARDWAKTNAQSKGLLSFLTQSRKAHVNVTFIAQEITTMEKQFRVLAEWELYIVSSDHVPLGFLGKSPFRYFICSKRDSQNGVLIQKSFKSYRREFFRLYGSFTFLDSEMNELAAAARVAERHLLERVGRLRLFWEWLRSPLLPSVKGSVKCGS